MLAPFTVLKTAQAAAALLKTSAHVRMSRLRLLKLLYIADRERLAEVARPITGDRVVAMAHGPVLSTTYDLVKGTAANSQEWGRYFRSEENDVCLLADPGNGELSKPEVEKLQEVAARFANQDDWEVAEYTHQYPEWQKHRPSKGSSAIIPEDDLLEAVGLSDLKDDIKRNAQAERLAHQLFARGHK